MNKAFENPTLRNSNGGAHAINSLRTGRDNRVRRRCVRFVEYRGIGGGSCIAEAKRSSVVERGPAGMVGIAAANAGANRLRRSDEAAEDVRHRSSAADGPGPEPDRGQH